MRSGNWVRTAAVALTLAMQFGVGAEAARKEGDAPAPRAERAWIGVFLGDAVDGGVELIAIVPGSPAARAGLQVGDVIVGVEQLRLVDVEALARVLDETRPGRPLELQVLRAGRTLERVVETAERPPSPALVSNVVPAPVAPPPPAPPVVGRFRGSGSYGLGVAELTPDLRRHLGAPEGEGVLLTRIEAEGPAAGDGFLVGDVLVRLGDVPVRHASDLERLLRSTEGEAIRVTLVRQRRETEITVRPNAVPGRSLERGVAEGAMEQAVRVEIERLERRIERLKRRLEELEGEATGAER